MHSEQFRQRVLDEWTAASTIAAWRKWYRKTTIQTQALTDALLDAAQVRPGQRVLDLASGSGQPAIDLAHAVGAMGQVTATDLSAGMLATAEEHARLAGLANLTFRQADAHDLPFVDGAFDVVTSRLGAMYFADIQRVLSEIRQILVPGGRVAFVVWGPMDRGTFMSSMVGPFLRRVPPPSPSGEPPGRFTVEGGLRGELERTTFYEVEETHHIVAMSWPGTPEEYWQFFYDVAVPMHPLFDGLPPGERTVAVGEVADLLRAHYDGQVVHTTQSIVVTSGVR